MSEINNFKYEVKALNNKKQEIIFSIRGLRVEVLSNFSLASLDASLIAAGLAELVDVACAAMAIGTAKPEPRPILASRMP